MFLLVILTKKDGISRISLESIISAFLNFMKILKKNKIRVLSGFVCSQQFYS